MDALVDQGRRPSRRPGPLGAALPAVSRLQSPLRKSYREERTEEELRIVGLAEVF